MIVLAIDMIFLWMKLWIEWVNSNEFEYDNSKFLHFLSIYWVYSQPYITYHNHGYMMTLCENLWKILWKYMFVFDIYHKYVSFCVNTMLGDKYVICMTVTLSFCFTSIIWMSNLCYDDVYQETIFDGWMNTKDSVWIKNFDTK